LHQRERVDGEVARPVDLHFHPVVEGEVALPIDAHADDPHGDPAGDRDVSPR